jgi:hypothetical protein
MMFLPFGALHRVVSARPERILNRLRRILMKGLAKELRTEVSPSDPVLFAAAFDNRRNA